MTGLKRKISILCRKRHRNAYTWCYGRVAAIQIRRDTIKEGQQRYIWFSSSFAPYEPDKYIGGTGCGSPRDILYPPNTDRSILCITEGRFKFWGYTRLWKCHNILARCRLSKGTRFWHNRNYERTSYKIRVLNVWRRFVWKYCRIFAVWKNWSACCRKNFHLWKSELYVGAKNTEKVLMICIIMEKLKLWNI